MGERDPEVFIGGTAKLRGQNGRLQIGELRGRVRERSGAAFTEKYQNWQKLSVPSTVVRSI